MKTYLVIVTDDGTLSVRKFKGSGRTVPVRELEDLLRAYARRDEVKDREAREVFFVPYRRNLLPVIREIMQDGTDQLVKFHASRIINSFSRSGILSFEQLDGYDKRNLKRIRGLGKVSLSYVLEERSRRIGN